jgi:hydrogenase expression/formation protein HypD
LKYIDEYRDRERVKKLGEQIHRQVTKPWVIMEICGGQTHSIMKYNLQEFLPENITLIHGPGCPVCVTPIEKIDKALFLASDPDIILTSFGDMLRVPGSEKDLLSVKADGGDVRIVYSPLDAVKIAKENPSKKVVFFAVGFETTAPANALSIAEAKREGLKNYFLLTSHVLVPPAIIAILSDPASRIQGFLAAGHVCTIMGYHEYIPISKKFNIPIVITGFEPVDILQGISATINQLESGQARTENQYSRAVTEQGNIAAQKLLNEIFEVCDREWRGIGIIPKSGLQLNEKYSEFDVEKVFRFPKAQPATQSLCIAGQVLRGLKKPVDCPAFSKECTPEHPLGAPMVSSEGACSAYYRYNLAK